MIFAVVVLVIALFFGAGVSRWIDRGVSFAATPAQTVSTSSEAVRAELAAVLPSQQVLSELYDKISPSVVNIQVTSKMDLGAGGIPGFPFGTPETPGDGILQGEGSGFIYDNNGHIVTNNHVVENAESITVYFANGMWADATLVAADPAADLALIKVTPPEGVTWQPLTLAPAEGLDVGYYVVAVGSPFGLDETMTVGVVSALGRSMQTDPVADGSSYSLPDVIQTDAAINPGNSGGPLLNLLGEVVGVNFAINSPVRANSGVGFAIPVSVIERVVPALISDGAYRYSYLGVAGGTVNAGVTEEQELPENTLGVYVAQAVESGPAAEGGVQEGDIITAIDDQPVARFEDLLSYLFRSTQPGQEVTLTVLRDGDQQTITVTLGERPSEQVAAQSESGRGERAIGVAEAIDIAREAVQKADVMTDVESADVQPDEMDGRPVWIVTLTSGDTTATVTVDAETGDVLQLNVH
jgi:2-alkenal reductase